MEKRMNKILLFFALLIFPCFFLGCGDERLSEVPVEKPVEEEEEPVEQGEIILSKWIDHGLLRFYFYEKLKCPIENVNWSNGDFYDYYTFYYGTLEGSKWKLILDISGNDTIDYSCNSIIYHFQDDGIVTVTSDVKEVINGDFTYNFHEPDRDFCILVDSCYCVPYEEYNFAIGENSYYCTAIRKILSMLYLEYTTENNFTITTTFRKEKLFYKIE